eukprot:Hpha_TRINITY_DN15517_c2_g4::TRINITY_DN15517_c2_g4_i1::g.107128::m.107128
MVGDDGRSRVNPRDRTPSPPPKAFLLQRPAPLKSLLRGRSMDAEKRMKSSTVQRASSAPSALSSEPAGFFGGPAAQHPGPGSPGPGSPGFGTAGKTAGLRSRAPVQQRQSSTPSPQRHSGWSRQGTSATSMSNSATSALSQIQMRSVRTGRRPSSPSGPPKGTQTDGGSLPDSVEALFQEMRAALAEDPVLDEQDALAEMQKWVKNKTEALKQRRSHQRHRPSPLCVEPGSPTSPASHCEPIGEPAPTDPTEGGSPQPGDQDLGHSGTLPPSSASAFGGGCLFTAAPVDLSPKSTNVTGGKTNKGSTWEHSSRTQPAHDGHKPHGGGAGERSGTRSRNSPSPRTLWDVRSPAANGAARTAAAAGLDKRPIAYDGELLFPSDAAGHVARLDAAELHLHVVILILSAYGEVEYWNEQAELLTGIPAESAVGQDIRAFLPIEEEQDTMMTMIDAAFARTANGETDEISSGHRFALTRNDGVTFCHLTLKVTGGYTRNLVMVTGRPSIDTGWRLGYAQWVLHQMKAPLQEVGKLVRGTDLESDVEGPLESARELAYALSPEIQMMMISWAPLRVSACLQRLVAENAEMAAEYSVSVSLGALSPNLVDAETYTDCLQLARSVSYFINNAIRFSAANGSVVVSVSLERYRTTQESIGSLRIYIDDSGDGIPEEILRAVDEEDCSETGAPGLVSTVQTIREMGGKVYFTDSMLAPVSASSLRARRGTMRRRGTEPAPLLGSGFLLSMPTKEEKDPEDSVRRKGTRVTIILPFIPPAEAGLAVESLHTRTRGGSSLSPREERASLPGIPGTPCRDLNSPVATGDSGAGSSPRLRPPPIGDPIRVLLIEPNIVHRMSFCHHLWQRQYLMTVAMSSQDSAQHLGGGLLDLVIVDVEAVEEVSMVVNKLKETEVQVLLASRRVNELQREEIDEAGWFHVHLPVQSNEINGALNQIEAKVMEVRDERKRISEMRAAFKGGMSSVSWEKTRLLGKGAFGKVFEATNSLTGARLAVKVIQLGSQGKEHEAALLREVQVMNGLVHPNIVHYFWAEQKEDELLIFMEYAKDGCLSAKVPKGGMPVEESSRYMAGIVRGLAYLHSQDIIHRDMKVANVLLVNDVPKITDFGTAIRHSETEGGSDSQRDGLSNVAGTPQYMSPEVLNGAQAGRAADVWATGCLLMELSTDQQPFAHVGGGAWGAVRYVSHLNEGEPVNFGPYNYHELVMSFLHQCVVIDDSLRWTAEKLLKHPFIENIHIVMTTASLATGGPGGLGVLSPRAARSIAVSPRAGFKNALSPHAGQLGYGNVMAFSPRANLGSFKRRSDTGTGGASVPVAARSTPKADDGTSMSSGDNFSGWGSPKANQTCKKLQKGEGAVSFRVHRLRELLTPETPPQYPPDRKPSAGGLMAGSDDRPRGDVAPTTATIPLRGSPDFSSRVASERVLPRQNTEASTGLQRSPDFAVPSLAGGAVLVSALPPAITLKKSPGATAQTSPEKPPMPAPIPPSPDRRGRTTFFNPEFQLGDQLPPRAAPDEEDKLGDSSMYSASAAPYGGSYILPWAVDQENGAGGSEIDEARRMSISDFEVGTKVFNPALGQGEVYSKDENGEAVLVMFQSGEVTTFRRTSISFGKLQLDGAQLDGRARRRSSCWSVGGDISPQTFCTRTAPKPLGGTHKSLMSQKTAGTEKSESTSKKMGGLLSPTWTPPAEGGEPKPKNN